MSKQQTPLSASDIEVRIWGFVVIAVTCILCFIVVALLYSVTFVTQPIKSMAPIDQAYTKMLNDIVLLIVGGIGGVMTKRAVNPTTNAFKPPETTSTTQPICVANNVPNQTWTAPSGALPVWVNPPLDESWTPPPPPTTPPDHVEPDEDRQMLALARRQVE